MVQAESEYVKLLTISLVLAQSLFIIIFCDQVTALNHVCRLFEAVRRCRKYNICLLVK